MQFIPFALLENLLLKFPVFLVCAFSCYQLWNTSWYNVLKYSTLCVIIQAERDGSNEYSNYQPGSLNTTDQLIRDLSNIDIVFHIGDITYANGYISQWDQFTAQVEPIASTVPYMIGRFISLHVNP